MADQPRSPKPATLVSVSNCSRIYCVALNNNNKKKEMEKYGAYVHVFSGISRRLRRQQDKPNECPVSRFRMILDIQTSVELKPPFDQQR